MGIDESLKEQVFTILGKIRPCRSRCLCLRHGCVTTSESPALLEVASPGAGLSYVNDIYDALCALLRDWTGPSWLPLRSGPSWGATGSVVA